MIETEPEPSLEQMLAAFDPKKHGGEAMAGKAAGVEAFADFHRTADARWAELVTSGMTIPWDSAKAYLDARARGEKARKPAARKKS